MQWTTETQYRGNIDIDGKSHNILVTDTFGEFVLYANGEYVADFDSMPSRADIVKSILESIQLNRLSRASFSGMGAYDD